MSAIQIIPDRTGAQVLCGFTTDQVTGDVRYQRWPVLAWAFDTTVAKRDPFDNTGRLVPVTFDRLYDFTFWVVELPGSYAPGRWVAPDGDTYDSLEDVCEAYVGHYAWTAAEHAGKNTNECYEVHRAERAAYRARRAAQPVK